MLKELVHIGFLGIVLAAVFGLVSCKKDSSHELQLTVDAMRQIKTVRMVSKPPQRTWEFVCPDKVHRVDADTGDEQIDIGKKFFLRERSGSWSSHPRGAAEGIGCRLLFEPWLLGPDGQLNRILVFESLGPDTVDGQTCEIWWGRNMAYPRDKGNESYRNNHANLGAGDIAICVNPANHRIVELKESDQVWRFYDFDDPSLKIEEPVMPPASDSSPPGSLQ